jgi:hypothetical protein
MYKALSVLRRSREYKKRRESFRGTHAAGISHRRGSWLACRREMLLNRQKFLPRSNAGEASDVLVVQTFLFENIHDHAYTPYLNCVRACLACSDAQRLLEFEDPDFAVAGLSGSGHVTNRLHHLFCDRIVDCQLDFRLGQKFDAVLGAPINLCVPMLASVAMNFGNRQALDPNVSDRLPYFINFKGLYHCGDELHAFIPACTV